MHDLGWRHVMHSELLHPVRIYADVLQVKDVYP